ncbi:protein-export chaperone SecB [Novosphingobium tardum]|uniref:Protein-export protein SecB n=1 Tax=Novosphingobium tardum TaxID=1538021 RepID=A0ABV8RNE9_9SPHN
MANEGDIISDLGLDDQATGPATNGEDTSPAVGIISQYVKDLSVENPNAPESYSWEDAPQVDVQFNIGSRNLGPDVHEVELKINITSRAEQGTAFIVELAYCGLIGMRNVTEEMMHPFLFAEAPRILFPFARQIVADAVRNAGYPPLMLEPIDFNGLYVQQIAQRDAEQGGQDAPFGNA